MLDIEDIEITYEEKELYELDDKKVKNLDKLVNYQFDSRYVGDKEGNVFLIKKIDKGKIYGTKMLPFHNRYGYIEYVLTDKFRKKKHMLGHRIVAGLFIPLVEGKDYVNHKDGDRANNEVSNLEWITHRDNIKHSYNVIRPNRTHI